MRNAVGADENITILNLAAKWRALEAEMIGIDDEGMGRLADQQYEIGQRMAKLTPTTALAAIEQLDLLSEHDDCGMRAIRVLRELSKA
jgi:hypothetical protein